MCDCLKNHSDEILKEINKKIPNSVTVNFVKAVIFNLKSITGMVVMHSLVPFNYCPICGEKS